MYAEPRDLIARFGKQEIADLLGTPSEEPDETNPKIMAACVDAAAIADGYLGRVTLLPMRHVPMAVVAATADIARYRLHDDQSFEGGDQGKTTQRMRYEDAIKWLKSVAEGKSTLFADAGNQREDNPDAPFPMRKGARIAVVASPVVFDQVTLGRMDAVRKR